MSRYVMLLLLSLLLCSLLPRSGAFAAQSKTYTRTVEAYQIPDVSLVNQDGAHGQREYLVARGSDRPVRVFPFFLI